MHVFWLRLTPVFYLASNHAKAANILLKGDCVVQNELLEMEGQNERMEMGEQSSHVSICDKYLSQAAIMFLSDCQKGTGMPWKFVHYYVVLFMYIFYVHANMTLISITFWQHLSSMRMPADHTKKKLNSPEVLQEPFFSKKLLQLIDILSNFRLVICCSLSHHCNHWHINLSTSFTMLG